MAASWLEGDIGSALSCCHVLHAMQVFAAWHARKRADRENKRAAEAEDRKKKVGGKKDAASEVNSQQAAHNGSNLQYASSTAVADLARELEVALRRAASSCDNVH